MNYGMTWSLVAMYAVAVVILAVCILKDIFRSTLRSGVSLGLLMLSIPIAVFLTRGTIDRLTSTVLHMFDLSNYESLLEAIPSLEEGIVALVHMLSAPEIYRLIFFILLGILGLTSWLICRAVEKKKPELAYKNKAIGAAIGVVSGVIMIVAVMAPTAGYAINSPEVVHILGEYEQIQHEGAEDMSNEAVALEGVADKTSHTPLLGMVRALGGRAIFNALTTTSIDGEETNLNQEFHGLSLLGEDVAVLTAVPIAEYGELEYMALKGLGEAFEYSALLRVLGAETVSSLCTSWLKGEPFLMFGKPEMDQSTGVALDAAMFVLKNTTKDSIARDVRGLTPAIAAAIRTMNLMNSISNSTGGTNTDGGEGSDSGSESGSSSGSSGGGLLDNIETLVSSLTQELETEESKEVVVRAGIGLVAKELQDMFVKKDDTTSTTPTTPSTGDSTSGDASNTPSEPSTGDVTQPETPTETPTIPSVPDIVVPEDTKITQEEYDVFVEELTDLAVSGVMKEDEQVIVEEVKGIRDSIGIDISDEALEQLVSGVLNSPFASLFQ